MGQDEVAPRVFFTLFRVVIGELQCGAANAAAQANLHQVVVGVKVVQHHVPHIAGWVDQAVRQVCGDRHGTPKVADKEAKGMPLVRVASSLKNVTHCLEVDLYVLGEVQNLVQSIQAGINPADNESCIDI